MGSTETTPATRELRLSPVQAVNLALRVALEVAVVAALGYWGVWMGHSAVGKVLLGIGAPAAGFGLWGAVDFHDAGRPREALRLLQELLISGLAAAALHAAGQHGLAWALALLSIGYHALVYASGERLLKPAADSS